MPSSGNAPVALLVTALLLGACDTSTPGQPTGTPSARSPIPQSLEFRPVVQTSPATDKTLCQAKYDNPRAQFVTCDQNGQTEYVLGPEFLDGGDVTDAAATFSPNGPGYVINLTFTSAGGKTWATYTAQNVGKQVAIVLNRQVVSAPVIQSPVLDGKTQISGNFTQQQAQQLAGQLSGR